VGFWELNVVVHKVTTALWRLIKTLGLLDGWAVSVCSTDVSNIEGAFTFFVNEPTWCTVFTNMFISILYMFRAAMCPSSGVLIVSVRYLVYVTLCKWPFGVQVGIPTCMPDGHIQYTEWHIPGVELIQLTFRHRASSV